jgi:hypothetical protein
MWLTRHVARMYEFAVRNTSWSPPGMHAACLVGEWGGPACVTEEAFEANVNINRHASRSRENSASPLAIPPIIQRKNIRCIRLALPCCRPICCPAPTCYRKISQDRRVTPISHEQHTQIVVTTPAISVVHFRPQAVTTETGHTKTGLLACS